MKRKASSDSAEDAGSSKTTSTGSREDDDDDGDNRKEQQTEANDANEALEQIAELRAKIAERDAQIAAVRAKRLELELAAERAELELAAERAELELAAERAQRDAQLAAERAQRDAQLAAERAEWDAQIAELDAQIAERDALANGSYYTTISQLWDTTIKPQFRDENYGNSQIARKTKGPKNVCHVYEKDSIKFVQADLDPYAATMEFAEDETFVETASKGSSRTSHSNDDSKRLLWPVNIFGKKASILDHIAHLVPAGPTHADTWWFVVPWLFGGWFKPDNPIWTSWTVQRKAIHGARRAKGKREAHSGIKHMVTNMVRIPGQLEFMDNFPCLLIVPIMEIDEVREWEGDGYEAIVLVDEFVDEEKGVDCPLNEVVKSTKMDEVDDCLASTDDIEKARKLLELFLLAIFTAQKKRPNEAPPDIFDEQIPIPPGGITVPSSLKAGMELRVRKIKFEKHTSKPQLHPAPDPILLASKAAVVFSSRHKQALAAGAEPQDDWTDLDELAAQDFLEWRQERIMEKMDSVLVDGFVGKDSTTA